MSGINHGRVILGGFVAGIVLVIAEIVANVLVFAEQNRVLMERLSMSEPGGAQIAAFSIISLAVGITMIWLYAAIRPRYGAGPKTAVCAGLFTWALYFLFPTLVWTAFGVISAGMVVAFGVWMIVELVIAALAGAALYTEAETPAAAAEPGAAVPPTV